MKIALTVKGVGLGAWLDQDFDHCGYVLIVEDDNSFESWNNPALDDENASTQALAQSIVQAKPDVLVTGDITNSQKEFFSAQNISVLDQRQGFVLDLLDETRG